jgi:hypothetical protein
MTFGFNLWHYFETLYQVIHHMHFDVPSTVRVNPNENFPFVVQQFFNP